MNGTRPHVLTVGTRTSRLALWQTNHIIQRLQASWLGLECRLEKFVTRGDKTLDKPLPAIGGKGLFTAELERALHDGAIDIAVHSLKDLPIEDAPGLTLGAITSRADARDGLVARDGWTLATLPPGAVVGTSSIRRQAQLLAARPDLTIKSIRGNVETRIRKVMEGQYDAAVLAAAGLQRLGLTDAVTEWLPLDVMAPAPGQGALAVQCRAGDAATLALLAAIDDAGTRAAVTAERAFLGQMGGGCSAPIAAYAIVERERQTSIQMQALVAAPDGNRVTRVAGKGTDAIALGAQLAQQAITQGAGDILAAMTGASRPLPLPGKRIVITRAPHQAQTLCGQLAALGATPVVLPAVRIAPMPDGRPLDQAIQSLTGYDWVVFTSVNGVTVFWDRMAALGSDKTAFDGIKVAAVGPATAQALRERDIQPDFVPGEFVGEAIAAGLGDVSGRRILLPRAEIARKKLAETLAAQGALVDDIPIYRTLPADISAEDLAQLEQGVDAITFTSSSTVRYFVGAVREGGDGRYNTLLQNTIIACIGPVTAATARELGLEVNVVASEYTTEGLVQALVDHFRGT